MLEYLKGALGARGALSTSLFKARAMDVDVVTLVRDALGGVGEEGGAWAMGVLYDIAFTKGFSMTCMMLEPLDIEKVRTIVERIGAKGVGKDLEAVKQMFRL